jgi:hypothetical protein
LAFTGWLIDFWLLADGCAEFQEVLICYSEKPEANANLLPWNE